MVDPSVFIPLRRCGNEQVLADRHLTICRIHYRPDLEICVPVGEVDLCTAPLLRRIVREIEHRQVPRVVVDLAQVAFLDVAGVRVLAAATDRARASGRQLALVVCTRPVRLVLELRVLMTLTDRLSTYPELAEALSALTPGRRDDNRE